MIVHGVVFVAADLLPASLTPAIPGYKFMIFPAAPRGTEIDSESMPSVSYPHHPHITPFLRNRHALHTHIYPSSGSGERERAIMWSI